MAIVGYLEGTDPLMLTELAIEGIGTLPLSNGADNHGRYIAHLTPSDNVSVVVGYFHKLTPISGVGLKPADMLFACRMHNIPVLLIVPREHQEEARRLLDEVADYVECVDPGELYEAILRGLGRG